MIKVRNITAGPRGLHTKEGPVMLAPGQEAELDMDAGELASSKRTGWFVLEGQSAKEVDKTIDSLSDEELQAILKDAGVVPDGRWGHDKLVAEAKKIAK